MIPGWAGRRRSLFRCRDMWSLAVLDLRLRFEPALQAAVDPVEINIDHRRDEQRQKLRNAETADHGDAEWLAQFSTRAGANRNRQRAENRQECRPPDGPEPPPCGLPDGVLDRQAPAATLQREVHHHDGVLLDD